MGETRTVGVALLELVTVMDRLRRECPWDAKQTHVSLAPYLLEETYEALDALERQDLASLREELGDVLHQVLFHSRIAAERADETGFTIDDVAADIAAKLIRRHPHVFADVSASSADEVRRNWDKIKRAEREARDGSAASALDGVPMGQPALSLAAQLLRRAGAAGVPGDVADLPVAGEAGRTAGSGTAGSGEAGSGTAGSGEAGSGEVSAIGAELFAVAARARDNGLDPELELRHAARVYSERVRDWERQQRGGLAGSSDDRSTHPALQVGSGSRRVQVSPRSALGRWLACAVRVRSARRHRYGRPGSPVRRDGPRPGGPVRRDGPRPDGQYGQYRGCFAPITLFAAFALTTRLR